MKATWLRTDGTMFPTSSVAASRAHQAQYDAEVRQAIHRVTAYPGRAPAALIGGFAVLRLAARTPVTVGGVTISHPPLRQVPLGILAEMGGSGTGSSRRGADPRTVRLVQTGGHRLWIFAEPRGITVTAFAPGRFPTLVTRFAHPDSGVSAGTPTVAAALAHGAKLVDVDIAGVRYAAGVLPRAHPTTTVPTSVSGRRGPQRTIHPPLGVYFTRIGRVRQHGASS